jgi:hypothetical protein
VASSLSELFPDRSDAAGFLEGLVNAQVPPEASQQQGSRHLVIPTAADAPAADTAQSPLQPAGPVPAGAAAAGPQAGGFTGALGGAQGAVEPPVAAEDEPLRPVRLSFEDEGTDATEPLSEAGEEGPEASGADIEEDEGQRPAAGSRLFLAGLQEDGEHVQGLYDDLVRVAPTWPNPCRGLQLEECTRSCFGQGVPLEVEEQPDDSRRTRQQLPLPSWQAAGPQQQEELPAEVRAGQGVRLLGADGDGYLHPTQLCTRQHSTCLRWLCCDHTVHTVFLLSISARIPVPVWF